MTYGGIDLTPSPQALAAAYGWWHVHRIREFDYRGDQLGATDHLPVPPQPPTDPPRIGVMYWPVGASRWATCHLLATGAQLARVQALSDPSPDLVFSDGTRSVTAPMFRLAARPVSQRSDGREMYLLTLVDDRYYWWAAGDQAAPSAASDWDDLISTMLASVGVGSPSVDTADAGYSTPTASRWDVGYQPLPVLIDAACRTVGMRLIRSLAGDVSVVSYATAAAADESRWAAHQYECLAGGRAATSEQARTAPASCAVVFLGSPDILSTKTLAGLAPSGYGSEAGVADRTGEVVADMPASAAATPRDDYATAAATDFYLWHLARTDATFRGVRVLETTGLEDACEWVWAADAMATRVLPAPRFDHNVYGYRRSGAAASGACSDCLTSCAWPAGLTHSDCVRFSVLSASGKCSGIVMPQALILAWDGGASAWISAADAFVETGSGTTGTVSFSTTTPVPSASIDAVAGTYLGCDGEGGILFAFGGPVLCGGTSGPCDNYFIAKFECNSSCCDTIDGWAGAGWYCVVDAGGDCADAGAVELIEGDQCNTDIEICSGPYADEATAEGVCGSAPTGACCHDATSARVTVSGVADGICTDCTFFNGTWTLTNFAAGDWRSPHIAGTDSWCCVPPVGCGYGYIKLTCGGGTYGLEFIGGPDPMNAVYSNHSPWKCPGTNVLTLDGATGECTGWPATITVTQF